MREAGLVSAALCLWATAAHTQSDPKPHFVVRPGASLMVYKIASINPDCSSRGHATINLIEGPQGGQASVGEVRDYVAFAPGNPRAACNHRKLAATEMFYRASPNFIGFDNFSAEVIDSEGVARTRHFTVEVR